MRAFSHQPTALKIWVKRSKKPGPAIKKKGLPRKRNEVCRAPTASAFYASAGVTAGLSHRPGLQVATLTDYSPGGQGLAPRSTVGTGIPDKGKDK